MEESNNKNSKKDSGEHYIKLYDFMLTELNLAKYELLIYAYIYSFSKQGMPFTGSQRHLMQKFNIGSNNTVNSALRNLVNMGLLSKEYITTPKGLCCSYYANRFPMQQR